VLTPAFALELTSLAVAIAVVQQSVELLALRRAMADDGVWAWSVLRREFVGVPAGLADAVFGYRGTLAVLTLRLAAAAAVPVAPALPCLLVMLATTLLVALRWRGSFNGGSDAMTITVLLAASVAGAFPGSDAVQLGCLWYVALVSVHSYVIAGLVKLRAPAGAAVFARPGIARAVSWTMIALECLFPLALLDPWICAGFIALAVPFHVVNAYVFGLDRFVFAWVATYPALLYCSAIV
jgi:hypothetical protein